jgi:hypothetical protein
MNWDLWGALKSLWTSVQSFEGAGVVGGLISLRWAPGETFVARLAWVVTGWGVVFFIGPATMSAMGIVRDDWRMGFGFLMGSAGAILLGRFIEAAKLFDFSAFLPDWVRRLLDKEVK